MSFRNRWVLGLSAVAVLMTACGAGADVATTGDPVTRGAAFTTFDRTLDGCSPGSQNGVNCNHYVCQDRVYVNGGPNRAHGHNVLEDGTYYFAVIAPGSQNGGAMDGASGNLSSSHDAYTNRTFTMSGGALSYTGTHPLGTSPNGQPIVGVAPFDTTPNPGGVYILAVCPIVNGVPSASPSDCKYDAFKTEPCPPPQCQPTCDEWDKDCVPCPPPPCQPSCNEWDKDCTVCPPPDCDPTCDPWSCSNCTPCIS